VEILDPALREELVERSTKDYCCFSSFYSFVQLSFVERVDVLFDLWEVASRLVCSRAASYPRLTASKQTFPRDSKPLYESCRL